MNKVAITCILVSIIILLSITSGCAKATFEVSNLTIDPQEVESGQSATVSVEIVNTGGAEGSYPAMLKINGIQVDEKNVTVGPGAVQQVTFSVTRTESGSCNIDVNGLTATLRVLTPAEFKVESFVVSPTEVTEGGSCTVTANVTNAGEVEGDYEAILIVNDGVQETKTMTIGAGDTKSVSFNLVMNQAGTYNLSIGTERGILTVVEAPVVYKPSPPVVPPVTRLLTYSSDSFYYKISYPPTFRVKDEDPYTVLIESTSGGITVLVDKLSVSETPEAYFDAVAAGKKQQLPTWTATSITEVKEDDVTIGFKYDYSNVVDGKNWIGKGMVFKKGGFGFYVVFTTPEAEWESSKEMAVRCLDSFVLPQIASGSYSNKDLGISLNLPGGWSLIETGSKESPLKIFPAYNQQHISIAFRIKTVPAGTTAKQYVADIAVALRSTDGGVQIPFSFANSATGYEYSDLVAEDGKIVGKLRYIALASDTRMYYFRILGYTAGMNAHESSVTQLAESLVVSVP